MSMSWNDLQHFLVRSTHGRLPLPVGSELSHKRVKSCDGSSKRVLVNLGNVTHSRSAMASIAASISRPSVWKHSSPLLNFCFTLLFFALYNFLHLTLTQKLANRSLQTSIRFPNSR